MVLPLGGMQPAKAGEEFFDQIRRVITGNPTARDIPSFMAALRSSALSPADRLALFDFFVLQYESKSLQRNASAEHPRVILNAQDGRFLMAYQPDSPCFDDRNALCIELMQFSDAKSRYEFGEVRFSHDATTPPIARIYPPSQELTCLACHAGGRANWDSYRLWPGAFGSNDGNLHRGSTELANAKSQIAQWTRDPYYRMFHFGPPDLASRPQSEQDVYAVNLGGGGGGRNTFLIGNLTSPNLIRIRGMLRGKGTYPVYSFALQGAINQCPDLESFIPTRLRASRHPLALANLRDDTRAADEAYHLERYLHVGDNVNDPRFGRLFIEKSDRTGGVRYVAQGMRLEGAEKVEMWSTAQTPARLRGHALPVYGFEAGGRDVLGSLGELIAEDSGVPLNSDCSTLKARSLEALAGLD